MPRSVVRFPVILAIVSTLLLMSPMVIADPLPAGDDDFLRQYAETFRFRLGHASSIEMTPEGDAVLYLRSGGRSFVRDLYVFDTKTGKERRLLTAAEVLGGGEEELTDEEKARRERMRLAARGFATFSLSPDGNTILAPLSGRLFLLDWRAGQQREIEALGGFPIDPRFSPDGSKIAYSAGGDLYAIHLRASDDGEDRVVRLTTSGGDDIANGVPEFAAQEEMDRDHGYWFSPDGSHVAYQRNDDSKLPTFYITDPANPAKAPNAWRYPRAGTNNTDVKLAVVASAGGEPVWVEWDREAYPYLATVRWQENAPLTVLVQNRHQTEQLLLAADPATGKTTRLLAETDEAWLNLDQKMPYWLPGGEHFLWTTERRGSWQLELRAKNGELVRELTPTTLIWQGFAGYLEAAEAATDGPQIYFYASKSPLDKHVYRVGLSGGRAQAITTGDGSYDIDLADDSDRYVLSHSGPEGATRKAVYAGDGSLIGELASQAEVPDFALNVEYRAVGTEPLLHTAIIRPNDFDPERKYPVILHVYGGPHAQMVTRAGARFQFDQWMANQGYIVVAADGRGTPNRGRTWERTIKYNFIDAPLADQASALRQLGEQLPELDLERVGVYGWSFGGYFSAMAVMRMPELFKAGVAGAPVTDWQEYDTHYTERYIGLPDENPEAYEVSNVTTYADQLENPLLIIHGTADDNVYFVHGLKMSNALLAAGKKHEFLPLSGQTHMVTDAQYVEQLNRRMMGFFAEHLQ